MAITWVQLGFWRNSVSIFELALKVTEDNFIIHNNLGLVLIRKGKIESALRHFKVALSLNPGYAEADKNNKRAAFISEKIETAADNLKKALRIDPVDLKLLAKVAYCNREEMRWKRLLLLAA